MNCHVLLVSLSRDEDGCEGIKSGEWRKKEKEREREGM